MLSPGDRVLMFETGRFSALRWDVAIRFGLEVDYVPGDWRSGVDPDRLERKRDEDREARKIKAVAVVHNETSTGVTSRIDEVRRRLDRARHPALLLVDTVSSLGSIDYRHDEWRVNVTVSCSQRA
jgi:alanine-glyoxylate transaminase/serine-glyoxylate transaminase/serine-pyruvate transaminase